MKVLNLNDLVPGHHVSITDNMFHAVEVIMAVTRKDRHDAAEVLRKLPEDKFPSSCIVQRDTGGRGNSRTKLVSFDNAIKLITVLPGRQATAIRDSMLLIFQRYAAGDMSLVKEIEANNESDDPIHQMARASYDVGTYNKNYEDDGYDPIAFNERNVKIKLDAMELNNKQRELEMELDCKKRKLEIELDNQQMEVTTKKNTYAMFSAALKSVSEIPDPVAREAMMGLIVSDMKGMTRPL